MFMILFNRDNLPTAYVVGPFATKEDAGKYAKAEWRQSRSPWVVLPFTYPNV